MPFSKPTWLPGRAGGTPVKSADLNTLGQGIRDLFDRRLVFEGVWTNAAPLVIGGLNGDIEGPYRIQVAGRLNGSADYQMSMVLGGTNAGVAESRGNGRNSWIESYQNADNTHTAPSTNWALQDNHLFLGQVRWTEACENTTDALLNCNSGRIITMGFVNTCKPVATLDARHLQCVGSGFLYHPRLVTSMTIGPAVGTPGTSFSGKITVDKLGLS